jgi:WD40 repeat protein
MSRSLKVRQECIEKVKQSVKRNGFLSQRALAEDVGLALATIGSFLRGRPVDRATFVDLCDKLSLDYAAIAERVQDREPSGADTLSFPLPASASLPNPCQPAPTAAPISWGEAVDVSAFHGREAELSILQHWVMDDRCRLITLTGMGGIGKTALSVKLAEQVQAEFEFVIWRSLRNAPPIQELLADLLNVLAHPSETDIPATLNGQLSQVLESLQTARCLLILDNAESILMVEERAGAYRDGYEAYGQLLRCVAETRHQSCLVLTSREKPKGLAAREGEHSSVRSLRVTGLQPAEGQAILAEKGFTVSEDDSATLIQQYAGNPLALKIVATTIQELFDGQVAQFLAQGTTIFGDISDLLTQQFSRLSNLEQQMMFWLAINREWINLAELQADIVPAMSARSLLEALESLQARSLIEKNAAQFTQQPVVMEYVTEQLIQRIDQEISTGEIQWFDRYALIKAQTQDYIRTAQIRLILKPIADQLLARLGGRSRVENRLAQILTTLHSCSSPPPGYAAGNLLNLLWQLQVDLSGYDFSELTVWQAHLQDMTLHRVNFADADLTKSVFTQTLGDILAAAFSPDGRVLATAIDQEICLWQVADGQQLAIYQGHTGWVQSLAFSPDGTTLASGSHDHTIRLWDRQTGQCLKTLRGHTGCVQTLAFSPDGMTLASGSHDHTIRLWNLATGQCGQELSGHSDRVFFVAFSPVRAASQRENGQTLISGGADDTVRIWQLATGHCGQPMAINLNWALAIALSPNGQTLATASDGKTVKFWDLQTGECIGTLINYNRKVWAVAFSPDGQRLATASDDRTVKLWSVTTGECLQTLQEHTQMVWLVAFSPDGQTLVSASDDGTVRLWSVATGQCLRTLKTHSNWVLSVVFDTEEEQLVSSHQDGQIRLWHRVTGTCLKLLKGHTGPVSAIVLIPPGIASVRDNRPPLSPLTDSELKGQLLASCSDDGTLKLWDRKRGECLRTLWGHHGWVQSLTVSPDGNRLASGSHDRTIKLWDWRSGECLQTLEGHIHRVKTVAFSPQGDLLASGSDDHTVKLWEVATGVCWRTLVGHQDWVLAIAFSPAGDRVASASGDRTLKLWDVQTGECLQTLVGHDHRIRSVVFNSDGTRLASGSDDHTVKVWDVKTGTCLQTLTGHQGTVWSVAFSLEGQLLASGSEDETIRLWQVETGEGQQWLRSDRPYEGMNITGVIGLTPAQKATLRALGAVELE